MPGGLLEGINVAGATEHARRGKVWEERTSQLQSENVELESALLQLKETQQQLMAQEKPASLGALRQWCIYR